MLIRKSTDWHFARLGDEMILMNAPQDIFLCLNPVGARIWDLLETAQDADAVCAQLLCEFEVSIELCRGHVDEFLSELEACKAIVRVPARDS